LNTVLREKGYWAVEISCAIAECCCTIDTLIIIIIIIIITTRTIIVSSVDTFDLCILLIINDISDIELFLSFYWLRDVNYILHYNNNNNLLPNFNMTNSFSLMF
jgi:hypothetical protein